MTAHPIPDQRLHPTEPGRSSHPLYNTWIGMISRCENESSLAWPYYGGRGISVCARWRGSFQAFVDDMGAKPTRDHSIDRINNDGPYAPDNCRWATPRQQGRNRSNNLTLDHDGESMTLPEWAERVGIPADVLRNRIACGWNHTATLTAPYVPAPFKTGLLTYRQGSILAFIADYIASAGYPPTVREIGRKFSIRSTNGVADHLRALERKGHITRDPQQARALRIVADRMPPREPGTVDPAPVEKVAPKQAKPKACRTCGRHW